MLKGYMHIHFVNTQNLEKQFLVRFCQFFLLEPLKNFLHAYFSTRFDFALVVLEIKGVKGEPKRTITQNDNFFLFKSDMYAVFFTLNTFENLLYAYLLTLPLCAGISRIRALSPAWTASPARETLISRTHLFLPHDLPPTKKSSTIKS